jgi:competence ComEA-like helix-hairpin-helix protein
MVIDGNTNSEPTLVTGSHNWTLSANESNDENFVVIRNHDVVKDYHETARNTYMNHAVRPAWQTPIGNLVNVNEANTPTLDTLDQIGPATAEAIVTYRENHEPFRTLDDLTRVDGIGPATADAVKNYVTFGDYAGIVDVNSAESAELQSIDGIGPATAENIISYRENHGDFSSVDQLTRVDGIGPATLESIRDDVKATSTEPELINVNSASADTLASLDGIGDVRGSDIVDYRTANGDFESIDQLNEVEGIGTEVIEGIRSEVTVGDAGSSLINVNKADTSTLNTLEGIGSVTAQKIVAERTVSGAFTSVDGLKRVDGIGDDTLDNIRDSVTVGESQLIDINTAGSSVLDTLPGIGPATAENIINYREQNGGFTTISDIKNVDGIGTVTYELIKGEITA